MKTNLQLTIILFILLGPVLGWWYLLTDMSRSVTSPITSYDYEPFLKKANYQFQSFIKKLILAPSYFFLRKAYAGLRESILWLRWISNRTDIKSIRNETEILSSRVDAHFSAVNSRLDAISQIVETQLSRVTAASHPDVLVSHTVDTGTNTDVSSRLENIESMIQTSLRDQHEELRNHRDGVVNTAQKPFVMQIIYTYDLLTDILNNSDSDTDVDLMNKMSGIKNRLTNALSQSAGVIPYDTGSDEFMPALQDIVSWAEHDDSHPARSIARIIKTGFKYRDETGIIRKEQIEMYE